MLRNILAASRYFIIIAVIGTFLSAIAVLVYDGVTVINIVVDMFAHGVFTSSGETHVSIEFIEVIDLFLLGTVLYITSLGLYELFIDDRLPTPAWLVIRNLEDLKGKLLGVIIVLLAVTFLGYVVNWDGKPTIVALGVAVGLVIFALGYILNKGFHAHAATSADEKPIEGDKPSDAP